MNPEKNTDFKMIMKHTSGSHLYGTHLDTSAHDQTGICLEPIDFRVGFKVFESYDTDKGGGDYTVYSLRKFLRLALAGNPTILQSLFVPFSNFTILEAEGIDLQDLAKDIVSKKAGKAFLGYMIAQRERLLGIRGQKRVKRPELEEKYGFDTKYAMHVIRLGLQGVELLETGRITLPCYITERNHLVEIRLGKVPFKQVLEEAEFLENEISKLRTTSHLPIEPNASRVEEWMIRTYLTFWSKNGIRTTVAS